MGRSLWTIPTDLLNRIQAVTHLPRSFWDEFRSDLSRSAEDPSRTAVKETALELLASELNLTAENLVRGKIDFKALGAHHSGNVTQLPEKYAQGFSRIRTSAHLFDRLESMHGWRARRHLLQKLQVTESIIADPDLLINVEFITDACEEMASMGIRNDQFFSMGYHSSLRNFHTIVGRKFRETRSMREMHERCFFEVIPEHYDQNSIYQVIFSDHDRIIVKVRPSPDVCDQLGTLWIGNRQTCMNRAGGFASLPAFKGLSFSTVHETRCIHRGDSTCVYEIVYRESEGLNPLLPPSAS